MWPNPDFDQPSDDGRDGHETAIDWPALAKLDTAVQLAWSDIGPAPERQAPYSRDLIVKTWEGIIENLHTETGPFSVTASVALASNGEEST